MKKSNNVMVIGVAVFAVGALLAFVGLRSQDKAVATQPPASQQQTTVDPNVRTVASGTAVQGAIQFTVPKGKQAVAVELPGVPGLAGYARPGDVINVYATVKTVVAKSKIEAPYSKLVLTAVKVLDVRAPAPGTAGTATYLLALDVNEAELVIFYAKYESMWFALTAPDQKPVTSTGRTYKNIL